MRPTGFAPANGDSATLVAVPEIVEELGDERYGIFYVDAPRVDTDATRAAVDAHAADDAQLLPEDKARFTVRLPAEIPLAVGHPISLGINAERLYFFDPETGAALST